MALLRLSLLLLWSISVVMADDVGVKCWHGEITEGQGVRKLVNCSTRFCARLLIQGKVKNQYSQFVPTTWFLYGCGNLNDFKNSDLVDVENCEQEGQHVSNVKLPKYKTHKVNGTLVCCGGDECNGYTECYGREGTLAKSVKCGKTISTCYAFYDKGIVTSLGCSDEPNGVCQANDIPKDTCKEEKTVQGTTGKLCCCDNTSYCNDRWLLPWKTTVGPQQSTTPTGGTDVVMGDVLMVMTTILALIINKMK